MGFIRIETFLIGVIAFVIAKGTYHMTGLQSIIIGFTATLALNILFALPYVGIITSILFSFVWAYIGSNYIWNLFYQLTWVRVVSGIVIFLFSLSLHVEYIKYLKDK